MEAKFILSKKRLSEQLKILENFNMKISYSYKTNREVGNVLQKISDVDFSIHSDEEINMIQDKNKIWFFIQAESENHLKGILKKGVNNFVIDNEIDLERLLKVVREINLRINLSLRMKFMEHRIGSGKYFLYGLDSSKVNELIEKLKDNVFINNLGVHIHRKSQNTSEWNLIEEIKDSLNENSLERINFLNLGGGLPSEYKSFTPKVFNYIFEQIKSVQNFLEIYGIQTYIEPGRFLAAPCIKLITEIIQLYGRNIVINATIYNCALDTVLTNTKMLIEGELSENQKGEYYLIKGNSPTRDDIFRYKVKLKNPKVGDKIVFLNAGAYNYTTDFFGYKKLKTEIFEDIATSP